MSPNNLADRTSEPLPLNISRDNSADTRFQVVASEPEVVFRLYQNPFQSRDGAFWGYRPGGGGDSCLE